MDPSAKFRSAREAWEQAFQPVKQGSGALFSACRTSMSNERELVREFFTSSPLSFREVVGRTVQPVHFQARQEVVKKRQRPSFSSSPPPPHEQSQATTALQLHHQLLRHYHHYNECKVHTTSWPEEEFDLDEFLDRLVIEHLAGEADAAVPHSWAVPEQSDEVLSSSSNLTYNSRQNLTLSSHIPVAHGLGNRMREHHHMLTVFYVALTVIFCTIFMYRSFKRIYNRRQKNTQAKVLDVKDDDASMETWVWPRAITLSIRGIDSQMIKTGGDEQPTLAYMDDSSGHQSSRSSSLLSIKEEDEEEIRREVGSSDGEDFLFIETDDDDSSISSEISDTTSRTDREDQLVIRPSGPVSIFFDQQQEGTLVNRYEGNRRSPSHATMVRRQSRSLKRHRRPSLIRQDSFDTVDTNVEMDYDDSNQLVLSSPRGSGRRRASLFLEDEPTISSLTTKQRRPSSTSLELSHYEQDEEQQLATTIQNNSLGVVVCNVATLLQRLDQSDSEEEEEEQHAIENGELPIVSTVRTRSTPRSSNRTSRPALGYEEDEQQLVAVGTSNGNSPALASEQRLVSTTNYTDPRKRQPSQTKGLLSLPFGSDVDCQALVSEHQLTPRSRRKRTSRSQLPTLTSADEQQDIVSASNNGQLRASKADTELGRTMSNVSRLLEHLMDPDSDADSLSEEEDYEIVEDGQPMVSTVSTTRRRSAPNQRELSYEGSPVSSPKVSPSSRRALKSLPNGSDVGSHAMVRSSSSRSLTRRSSHSSLGSLPEDIPSPGTLVKCGNRRSLTLSRRTSKRSLGLVLESAPLLEDEEEVNPETAIVVMEDTGRIVVSFSGSLTELATFASSALEDEEEEDALVGVTPKQRRHKLRRLSWQQTGEFSTPKTAARRRISATVERSARRLQRWQETSFTKRRDESLSTSRRKSSSARSVESSALKSLEQHLEACANEGKSLKQALDESIHSVDESYHSALEDVFYSPPRRRLSTLSIDQENESSLPGLPDITSSGSIRSRRSSSGRRLSYSEKKEQREGLQTLRTIGSGDDELFEDEEYEEALSKQNLQPFTKKLLLEANRRRRRSEELRSPAPDKEKDVLVALPSFENSPTKRSSLRASMVSLNTTTDTFRMSYRLLTDAEAEEKEGGEEVVIENLEDILGSVDKKCTDPNHRRKLENARLVVRVILGPHRKDYKTSTACFEAIDIVTAFRRDIRLVVQELTKGEQIWGDLVGAWSMVWKEYDETTGMAFPSMPEDSSVDAYEYSVLLLRQIYQFLQPNSPPEIEPNDYAILGFLSEVGLDDDAMLHLGAVGGGVASIAMPLKCLDANRKKRTRLSPYRRDRHYPLSLQDALRVVRSILGASHKRVTHKDCLRAIQMYGLLKIKYKDLAQQLEDQRTAFKDLHQELERLHKRLRAISKRKDDGLVQMEELRSHISQNRVPIDPELASIATMVYRISDRL